MTPEELKVKEDEFVARMIKRTRNRFPTDYQMCAMAILAQSGFHAVTEGRIPLGWETQQDIPFLPGAVRQDSTFEMELKRAWHVTILCPAQDFLQDEGVPATEERMKHLIIRLSRGFLEEAIKDILLLQTKNGYLSPLQ